MLNGMLKIPCFIDISLRCSKTLICKLRNSKFEKSVITKKTRILNSYALKLYEARRMKK